MKLRTRVPTLTTVIISMASEITFAQPDTIWTRTFGGSGDGGGDAHVAEIIHINGVNWVAIGVLGGAVATTGVIHPIAKAGRHAGNATPRDDVRVIGYKAPEAISYSRQGDVGDKFRLSAHLDAQPIGLIKLEVGAKRSLITKEGVKETVLNGKSFYFRPKCWAAIILGLLRILGVCVYFRYPARRHNIILHCSPFAHAVTHFHGSVPPRQRRDYSDAYFSRTILIDLVYPGVTPAVGVACSRAM